jgi:hypothetical protein
MSKHELTRTERAQVAALIRDGHLADADGSNMDWYLWYARVQPVRRQALEAARELARRAIDQRPGEAPGDPSEAGLMAAVTSIAVALEEVCDGLPDGLWDWLRTRLGLGACSSCHEMQFAWAALRLREEQIGSLEDSALSARRDADAAASAARVAERRAEECAREVRAITVRPLAGTEQVPVSAACCYVLWGDDQERPLYVGKSTNVLARLGAHLADPVKRSQIRRWSIIECVDGSSRLHEAETMLIAHYRPRYNAETRDSLLDPAWGAPQEKVAR